MRGIFSIIRRCDFQRIFLVLQTADIVLTALIIAVFGIAVSLVLLVKNGHMFWRAVLFAFGVWTTAFYFVD